MFSTIGTMVADAVVSVSLLTPAEAFAASTAAVILLGGLVLLAWVTREPARARGEKASHPSFRKAA